MGKYTYPIILVGAAALAFVLYKRNVFGALPVQCEPQAKSEAKRWMEEVLAYKKPEGVEQNAIDQATGMEQGRLIDYANLLRGRQEAPDMEYFRANGIGRPL
jgi:hypothetical protein